MKITIELKDEQTLISVDEGLSLEDALNAFCQCCLMVMDHAVENLEEKEKEATTEYLYDTVNIMFSNVLAHFAPELELRPNLTAEAIMRAEDAILNEIEVD